jgi:drug/metabolite transporter (DMT)-like permease
VAVILALVSSVMWGSADFLGGTLTRRRAALAVVGGSQLAGLIAMALVATVLGKWGDDPAYWGWAALASVSGFLGLIAFYAALARGTMGIVSPIAALGVLVPLVVGFARGDTPAALQVVGIVLALIGIVAASGPELSGRAGAKTLLLAAFAAAMFGTAFVGIAQGSRTSAVMTIVGMRVTTMVLVVVAAIAARSLGGLQRSDVLNLTVIGVFDAAANLFFGIATGIGFLVIVSVLGSLYPVTTVLLARWVHKERLVRVQYVGVAVSLTGVALISAGGAL